MSFVEASFAHVADDSTLVIPIPESATSGRALVMDTVVEVDMRLTQGYLSVPTGGKLPPTTINGVSPDESDWNRWGGPGATVPQGGPLAPYLQQLFTSALFYRNGPAGAVDGGVFVTTFGCYDTHNSPFDPTFVGRLAMLIYRYQTFHKAAVIADLVALGWDVLEDVATHHDAGTGLDEGLICFTVILTNDFIQSGGSSHRYINPYIDDRDLSNLGTFYSFTGAGGVAATSAGPTGGAANPPAVPTTDDGCYILHVTSARHGAVDNGSEVLLYAAYITETPITTGIAPIVISMTISLVYARHASTVDNDAGAGVMNLTMSSGHSTSEAEAAAMSIALSPEDSQTWPPPFFLDTWWKIADNDSAGSTVTVKWNDRPSAAHSTRKVGSVRVYGSGDPGDRPTDNQPIYSGPVGFGSSLIGGGSNISPTSTVGEVADNFSFVPDGEGDTGRELHTWGAMSTAAGTISYSNLDFPDNVAAARGQDSVTDEGWTLILALSDRPFLLDDGQAHAQLSAGAANFGLISTLLRSPAAGAPVGLWVGTPRQRRR